MTQKELSYLGGLVDGEGHITIVKNPANKTKRRVTPDFYEYFKVKMTTSVSLKLLVKKFGGGLTIGNRKKKKEKLAWMYQKSHKKANKIITKLLPYLLIKKKHTELAIELRKRIDSTEKCVRRRNSRKSQFTIGLKQINGTFKPVSKQECKSRDNLYKKSKKVIHTKKTIQQLMINDKMLMHPMLQRNKVEILSYLAGIMDGEGTFSIVKTKREKKNFSDKYASRVKVKMTDGQAIWLLAEIFGSSPRLDTEKKFPWVKRCLVYQTTDHIAYNIAKTLFPYLKETYKQAKIVIEFQEHKDKFYKKFKQDKKTYYQNYGTHARLPKKEIEFRKKMYLKIKKLNHQ